MHSNVPIDRNSINVRRVRKELNEKIRAGGITPEIRNAIFQFDKVTLRSLTSLDERDEQHLGKQLETVAKALSHATQMFRNDSRQFILSQLAENRRVSQLSDRKGWNLLHYACSQKDNDSTVKLLARTFPEALAKRDLRGQTPIHLASLNLSCSLLALAEESPGSFEMADSEGRTPMHLRCSQRFGSEEQELLRMFARVGHLEDCNGFTAVHAACEHSLSTDQIMFLLNSFPEIFMKKDSHQRTLVHKLCKESQLDATVMQKLSLDFYEVMCLPGSNNRTPIHEACKYQRRQSFLAGVMENYYSVLLKVDGNNLTPVHEICAYQRDESIVQMIMYGIHDEARRHLLNDGDWTPIHAACDQQQSCEVMRFLVRNYGAQFVAGDLSLGGKPIQLAFSRKEPDICIIRELISAFPEYIDDCENMLDTLNRLAEAQGESSTLAELQNINIERFEHRSPLHEMCKHVSVTFILFLFNCLPHRLFAEPDFKGCSPIDYAQSRGNKHVEIVTVLLSSLAGANYGSAPEMQETVYCLVRMNLKKCLPEGFQQQLRQLRLNFGKFSGETLLHLACLYGHAENIDFLLKIGLSLDSKNKAGKTCLDFAFESGLQEIVFQACKGIDQQLLALLDPASRILRQPGLNPHHVRKSYEVFATNQKRSVEMHMLRRALKLDDNTLFRSLILLDLLDDELLNNLMTELRRERSSEFEEFIAPPFDCIGDAMDAALNCDRVDIVYDFAISRQTDLIPTCLRFLIQMKHRRKQKIGKSEQLDELHDRLSAVVVNALDKLYWEADFDHRILLFRYLSADFSSANCLNGPKFSFLKLDVGCECCTTACTKSAAPHKCREYKSVFEMIEFAGCPDIFATGCVRKYIDSEWVKPATFAFFPMQGSKCSINYRIKFYIHAAAFALKLLFLGWFIAKFDVSMSNWWQDVIVWCIFLSLLVIECHDLIVRRKVVTKYVAKKPLRISKYLGDSLNVYDQLILISMGIGLSLKLKIGFAESNNQTEIYACQMALASAYLLLGMRSIHFLNYFEAVGPMIIMIKKLVFHDLLPFLALILVILVSFGIFFFTLLQLNCSSQSSYHHIITIPGFLLFGYYEKNLEAEEQLGMSGGVSNCTADPEGYGRVVFDYFFFFIFLSLVNIVMINLLIALFSERVKSVKSRAFVLWRRSRWQMLREYQRNCLLPPPFSLLEYFIFWLLVCCKTVRHKTRGGAAGDRNSVNTNNYMMQNMGLLSAKPGENWPNENNEIDSADYKKFLKFQATVFRQFREHLGEKIVRNREDAAALLASSDNWSQRLQSELTDQIMTAHSAVLRQTVQMQEQLQQMNEQIKEQFANERKRANDEVANVRSELREQINDMNRCVMNEMTLQRDAIKSIKIHADCSYLPVRRRRNRVSGFSL